MKKSHLIFCIFLFSSLTIKAHFVDFKSAVTKRWFEEINKKLKKCPGLSLALVPTPSGGRIRFHLLKSGVKSPISTISVEIDQDLSLLILFSKTAEAYRRKHYNLFLRAVVFHFFIQQKKAASFRVASDIANPSSEKALRKYFEINGKENGTVYLSLSENNLKKAEALLEKYPDC